MVADGICVKGVVLLARLKHLRDSYGEPTLNEVLGRLVEADRDLLRGMLVLPSLWYPVALAIRLDEAITAQFPLAAHRFIFRNVGRTLANLDCEDPRGLLRRGDPHRVLQAASHIYGQHYRYAERTYRRVDAWSCLLTSTGPTQVAVTDCPTAAGWLERILELSGALDGEVDERTCRARGEPSCEHFCHWKVAAVAFTAFAAAGA